jgi:isopentenyldiphosphate isomerase
MADELIDIVDENNNLIGVQKMKSEAHRDGLWHRTAHLWLYNSKGEILLQLRAKNKKLYPALWDVSAAGHIGAGEEPIVSALREADEEIGIQLRKDQLDFFKTRKVMAVYREIKNNEFCYVYLAKYDGGAKNLRLQKEEVEEIKFVSLVELEANLREKSEHYVRHGKYWDDVIAEIKRRVLIKQ